jgi:hypothetical protein
LEDLGLDRRIILKLFLKKWNGGVEWIDVAQCRDRRWALTKVAMNVRFPLKMREIRSFAEEHLVTEGICFIEEL